VLQYGTSSLVMTDRTRRGTWRGEVTLDRKLRPVEDKVRDGENKHA
jgi:hypothetical protein